MKKNNKVFNPLLGKYLSKGDTFVCALVIKSAPDLVQKWRGNNSILPFHDWISQIDYTASVKGVFNKFIAKRLKSVVDALIAIWKDSDFESFDTFLEYYHKRALENTPNNSK